MDVYGPDGYELAVGHRKGSGLFGLIGPPGPPFVAGRFNISDPGQLARLVDELRELGRIVWRVDVTAEGDDPRALPPRSR